MSKISSTEIKDFVIGHYVSNEEPVYDQLIDENGDFTEEVIIWEPFQDHDNSDIIEMIDNDVDSLTGWLKAKGVEVYDN